jgi:hypothetical protein
MSLANEGKLFMVLRMDITVCFGKKKMQASKQSRPCMGGKQPLSDICVLYKRFFHHLLHVRQIS